MSVSSPSSEMKVFLPSSMSIIARNSFSAAESGVAAFAFTLYAALGRGGGGDGFGGTSSSSSSEMTIPLLTRAVVLDSVRLDDDFERAPALPSSESESFDVDFVSTGG
jgi:hypothetical protein